MQSDSIKILKIIFFCFFCNFLEIETQRDELEKVFFF